MPSTEKFAAWPPLASAAVCLLASTFLLLGAPVEKLISIYSNVANYSLPVLTRGGTDYVGLLETLEPLGAVNARASGSHWKIRYNNVEAEFVSGKARARIQGGDLDLPADFLLEKGRGLVPLASLNTLLPRFLGGPVTLRESARRLFIGDVAVHFTAQVSQTNPPRLVMHFTSPVNPTIATESGKLRMLFTHEPLVAPGSQTLTFDSKTIPSASYQENNGAVEVVVNGTVPLMASFADDGRTINIGPPPSALATPSAPANNPPASSPVLLGTTSAPPASRYFAVVDASHGGDERGAALSDQLAEKDVTLAFARRLRQELEARGLTTLVLRDGDLTLSPDQRAGITNSAHPAIYLCLHAASQGRGVRLFTALVPPAPENLGPFIAWDAAQAEFQAISRAAQASLAAELQSRQVTVRSLSAPLRPLNNVMAAAVAVELGPPSDDISELNSAAYQQLVASAIAAGLGNVRDKLEAGR